LDLGLAFAAVLILIYILMVGWFRSFLTPLIVMIVIPFSLIGVLPAHGLLHAFFTATSMIRFRPIMLTALAVVAGALVILADPIFQGLAIALMAGSLISMFTAPVLVPLLYFMANDHKASDKISKK